MTFSDVQSMGRDPQLLSRRLSGFLKPRVNAKALARQIDCDPRTAENILAGHWPSARHWLGIWRTFGEDVLDAVYRPQETAERLAQEVAELEREIEAKRAAHRALAGDEGGVAAPARRDGRQ